MADTDDLDFDSEVSNATGSSYAQMEDLEGCLLLIRPYEEGTRQSKTDAGKEYTWVETDTVVLQGPDEGDSPLPTDFFEGEELPLELEAFQFTGQQPTQTLLQKMKRGKKVLGVLVKGPATRGKNAPWLLEEPSPAQVEVARAYYKAKTAAENKADRASKAFD